MNTLLFNVVMMRSALY